MEGKFIVIDGTDGSGKGTQTELLVERLHREGFNVETISFPQYGKKSCGLVEEYLNGKYGGASDVDPKVASIFYACDRYDASFQINEWLNQGKIVIANRYFSSNIGHQAGKINDTVKRKEFIDWLTELEFEIFKIPKPDITLFLFVPAEIGQKLVESKDLREYIEKGKKKDIHEADIEHLKEAQKSYIDASETLENWERVDCDRNGEIMTREEIHELIWKKLNLEKEEFNSKLA